MTYNEIKKHKWKRNDVIREAYFINDNSIVFSVVGIIDTKWVALCLTFDKPILEDIDDFGKGKKYEVV